MNKPSQASRHERELRAQEWERQERLAREVAEVGEARASRLERELDRGIGELPPNVPPGWLGEVAPDMRATDADGPQGLNAGVIQENDERVVLLFVALLFFLFFPAAFFVLWRAKTVPQRDKIVVALLMLAGIAAVAVAIAVR